MIGLILSQSSLVMAVTNDAVDVNPVALDPSVAWYTTAPTGEQIGKVTALSRMVKAVFGVTDAEITPDKAKDLVALMNATIPKEWQSPGVSLKRAMVNAMDVRMRLIDPFDEEIQLNNLDKVTVTQPTGRAAREYDVLSNLNLTDFWLPQQLTKTKSIPNKAVGNRPGMYQIEIDRSNSVLANVVGERFWVTHDQIPAIRAVASISIVNSVQIIGDSRMVRLDRHEVTAPLLKILNASNETRKYSDQLILRFMLDIPKDFGLHPYSHFLQAQAWSRACNLAAAHQHNGLAVQSFSHNSVITEV